MTSFETSYNLLNPAQKKAVDSIDGPVMVIAGPGTGKTTILTLRIANILRKTDTAPDSILALTFTESGAYAMRKKLAEIIGPAAYKVRISTFHGFASEVFEQYPDYFERIIGSRVITEPEQIKIVKKILQSKKIKILRPYGDKDYYIGPLLREIQILKRENVSPKELLKSIREDSIDSPSPMLSLGEQIARSASSSRETSTRRVADELVISAKAGIQKHGLGNGTTGENEMTTKTKLVKLKKQNEKNLELAYVYEQYEKALAKQKYYDFEDMLLELIRAMEDERDFKLILQENCQYVLADEHQDANAAQNRILELLCDFHDSPNLFIVGDEKQAIYRFQGASLQNFLYFSEKYRDALFIDLEHNYRSHQGILDAAHSLIANNPSIPGRERKKLISLQMGDAPVFITECGTLYEELELIAGFCERMIKKGAKGEEIAVLYRDNKHADAVSRALKAHGIRHRIESDRNLLDEPEAAKLLILAKAINDPSDGEALASALFLKELGCDAAHVAELCAETGREKKPLYELANRYADTARACARLKDWCQGSHLIPCADFLHKLIQETGMVESLLKERDSLERLGVLQSFYDHVAEVARSQKTFYLKDLAEYAAVARDRGISAKRKFEDYAEGVRLMTAHRAKGLEFRHVFIIHAVDGVWGNRSSRNLFTIPLVEHARNAGRIEDERRLFYVAMTRARDTVNITYARSDGQKESLQSQFISEIDPALVDFDKLDSSGNQAYASKVFGKPRAETGLSILQEDFVKNKFLAQPLSVTHLNNYLECPWKYFFVNLVRVPQAQTKHQMYGTAVHKVLRAFFDAYREGRDLNAKKILVLFKHALDAEPMGKDDREESYAKGKRALAGYLKEYAGAWNRRLITEYSVKGVKLPLDADPTDNSVGISMNRLVIPAKAGTQKPTLELTGKLDKIEFMDDRKVVVVDYKTAKPKSRNEIEGKTRGADGNYKRQLVFYKLLLNGAGSARSDLAGIEMEYGEIDFIEPNERGKYKKERFEIADREVEELKKTISRMANEVTELGFIEKRCDNKDCEYCRLGKILVGKQEKTAP